MAFNIDADPINANWLRWKNWNVPVSNLSELISFLGLEHASLAAQRAQVNRLDQYFDCAPKQLREEVGTFLKDYPTA